MGNYTSEQCKNAKDCHLGDSCNYSHNRVEEFYHPEKYKLKFCQSYPQAVDACDYGNMCAFAHAESEILIDLLEHFDKDVDFYMFHFKTVWCPFSDAQHDR